MYSCAALVGVNGHAHTRQASPQYRKGWYRMAAKHSLESLEGVYAQNYGVEVHVESVRAYDVGDIQSPAPCKIAPK